MIRQLRCSPARVAGAFTIALLSLTLAGCQSTGNQANQAGNFKLITQPTFVQQWQTGVHLEGADSVTGIYPIGDTLHVLTNKCFDYAIKASSGENIYFNRIGTGETLLKGGPILQGENLIYATNHTLEMFTKNGRFLKSLDLQYTITDQPICNRLYVYVGLDKGGGRLSEIDTTKDYSPVVWEIMAFGLIQGAPATANGAFIFGSQDGGVRATTSDRSLFWPLLENSRFDAGSAVNTDIRTDGNGVYFSSQYGIVFCLDFQTGKIKWRYFAGVNLNTPPDVTATRVYQFVPGLGLVAIDKVFKMPLDTPDHAVLDENPFHPAKWTAPDAVKFLCEDAKCVYALSKTGTLLGLDKMTGQKIMESQRNDFVAVAANAKEDVIYAATRGGQILAIKPTLSPGSYGTVVRGDAAGPDTLAVAR